MDLMVFPPDLLEVYNCKNNDTINEDLYNLSRNVSIESLLREDFEVGGSISDYFKLSIPGYIDHLNRNVAIHRGNRDNRDALNAAVSDSINTLNTSTYFENSIPGYIDHLNRNVAMHRGNRDNRDALNAAGSVSINETMGNQETEYDFEDPLIQLLNTPEFSQPENPFEMPENLKNNDKLKDKEGDWIGYLLVNMDMSESQMRIINNERLSSKEKLYALSNLWIRDNANGNE